MTNEDQVTQANTALERLAGKVDSAFWPKVTHGVDIQLTHQEIALAHCALCWQPMETARKDGSIFIGQDSDGNIFRCSWEADDCEFDWYSKEGDQLAYPVRWMELPTGATAKVRDNGDRRDS